MATLRVLSHAVSVLLLLLTTQRSFASNAPTWSDRDLARLSEAVLTGRVLQITSGWDPAVNTIYTYVTVDVDEALKGAFGSRQVIVKQLGGVVDDIGLTVADQPTFAIGERVLLYLEVRPRDSTLYTAAQWQGKWTLEADTRSGVVAVRRHPGRAGGVLPADRQALSGVRALIATTAPDRHSPMDPSDAGGGKERAAVHVDGARTAMCILRRWTSRVLDNPDSPVAGSARFRIRFSDGIRLARCSTSALA